VVPASRPAHYFTPRIIQANKAALALRDTNLQERLSKLNLPLLNSDEVQQLMAEKKPSPLQVLGERVG